MGGTSRTTRRRSGPPTPQPELFSLEEEPGGGLPAPLSEVAGRQGKVERHVVEDLVELAPLVQILDLPVPQMVDNVLDASRIPERPMAVQVIEVPKILCSPTPSRSPIPEPQTVEKSVEVPTVLSSYAHRFADRRADRRHSSSAGSWWQAACSWFSPRIEFNCSDRRAARSCQYV